jgi:UDPglucose 6-dehydrogenase
MTEWNEFRGLDLGRVRAFMSAPVIVDARNVLDPAQTRALGFAYFCTGRERAGALETVGA